MRMIRKLLGTIVPAVFILSSCEFHQVRGNGHLETTTRQAAHAERIHVAAGFDVEITQDAATTLKIEADDNLLQYIDTYEDDGVLNIRTKDHVNLSSDNKITVYITTPRLAEYHLMGSGNLTGKSKFTGSEHLSLKILGSGDINLDVNTPDLEAEISGSGDITLTGETQKQTVSIMGNGNYKAENLKSEDTKIKIAGSGDTRVFAENNLDVSIAGSGSVFYKGGAVVKQHIAGSGEIKKID